MMEQEEIKTGGEYMLKEYQVEDTSDTSDMDEEYESENERDLDDEFWRQHQKSDRMLELEKQHKEESDIQEALLKSGEYVLLKHSGSYRDGILASSPKGEKAYKQNRANGDAQDVAFWRVLRTMGRNGFCCYDEAPYVAMIKRPYERWIKIRKEISPAPYSDISVEWQFMFKKEKCLNDLTLELLERKGSISKEDFVNLKREVDEVEIVWC